MMGNGPSLGFSLVQAYQDDEIPRKDRVFDVVLSDEAQVIGRFRCHWSPSTPESETQPCDGVTDAPEAYQSRVFTQASASGVTIQITMSKRSDDPEFQQVGPDRLEVRVEDDKATHFKKSFEPVYKKLEINGPGCGAVKSASIPSETFRFEKAPPREL